MESNTGEQNKFSKSGIITYEKINGEIVDVQSELHIDELFKVIHFLRSKMNKDVDTLKDLQRMGWEVPQIKSK